ncbi:hypothetical protein GCM10022631_11460 [Deinococcus rubellus]|uniref:hypothetical protein n=1 Tax=Deinococcus rubellus TaxID=1889240 RepID=UPI0031EAABD0
MSILQQKLNLTGAPAGTYTGYLELDGDIGSIGPDGLGLAVFKSITYDSSGNLKAADGASDYVIAAAVGGFSGHVARASLTILLNGAPVGGVLKFDLIESSPGIVDIKALYLQGKVQPVTPGQLANLTDLLAQATALVPQMTQSLADSAQKGTQVDTALSNLAKTTGVGMVRANKAALDADFASAAVGSIGTDSALRLVYLKQSGAANWGTPITNLALVEANSAGRINAGQYGLSTNNTAVQNSVVLQAIFDEAAATGREVYLPRLINGQPIYYDTTLQYAANLSIVGAAHGKSSRTTGSGADPNAVRTCLIYTGSAAAMQAKAGTVNQVGFKMSGVRLEAPSGTVALDLSRVQHHTVENCMFVVQQPGALGALVDGQYTGTYFGVFRQSVFYGNAARTAHGLRFTGNSTDAANGQHVEDCQFADHDISVDIAAQWVATLYSSGNYFERSNTHFSCGGNVLSIGDHHEPTFGGGPLGTAYFIKQGGKASTIIAPARTSNWPTFLSYDSGVTDEFLTYFGTADENTSVIGRLKVAGRNLFASMLSTLTNLYRDVATQFIPGTAVTSAAAAIGDTALAVTALTTGFASGTIMAFGSVTATLTAAAAIGTTSLSVSALTAPIASGVTGRPTTGFVVRDNMNTPATVARRRWETFRANLTLNATETAWTRDDQTGWETRRERDGGNLILDGFCTGNPNLNPTGGVAGYWHTSRLRDPVAGVIWTKRGNGVGGTGWGTENDYLNYIISGGGAIVLGVGYEWTNHVIVTLYNGGAAWTDATLPAPKFNGQRLTLSATQALTIPATNLTPATAIPLTAGQVIQLVGLSGTWRKL